VTTLQYQKREVKILATKLQKHHTLLQNRVEVYDREPRQLALIQQTTQNVLNLSSELLLSLEKIKRRGQKND